jgi:hypothetical protein
MSSEYLAMYLGIQPSLGAEHLIVPVRHFAANRYRLGDAIAKNKLFTDFETARLEMDVFWGNKNKTMAFLLDSSLPGRKNIIKGKAVHNLKMLFDVLDSAVKKSQAAPVIGGAQIEGSVSLAFGIKTIKNSYPTGFLSNEFYSRKIFSKEGYFIRASESGSLKMLPGFSRGNVFFAVEFTSMGRFDTDYYRTYA